MSDEIKIIVQNKQRKKINEVKTKRPITFEMLIKFINEKIKELPEYYTIYISKNHKGIEIKSDQQYQIYKNKVVYILEKDIRDIAPTLIRKDDIYFDDTMTNLDENLENEDMKINNDINEATNNIDGQFIKNLSDILKKILIRFKEVDSLLPEYNQKLIELFNKFEPNLVIPQINNISNIILEELKIIEDYIKFKGNNNDNKIFPKIDLENKENPGLVLPNIVNDPILTRPNPVSNIPYSCIPRIQKIYPDISFEKIGKK